MSEILHFKIGAGLKNIIGRELINDKFIAIFELVKNSYDAGAKSVNIKFENIYTKKPRIVISDDGKGMTKEDILHKWLFVAYSEKKHPTYRDNLKKRRNYAGAKGIGRFSCDRLGEKVELLSKTADDEYVNSAKINWSDFEIDDKRKFDSIDVEYNELKDKLINNSGTIMIIDNLRENWDRGELLKLKKALTQLVNPEATSNYDHFTIALDVEEEVISDTKIKDGTDVYDKDIVNGKIENHVFDDLSIKTTMISVSISEDGKSITTILNDRGIKLFEVQEKNKYSLKNISCILYSLNKTAKSSFTRIMGIEPINYGSVFIYKNGFRVFPYGEPEKDFFYIDRRKSQGYNRYLGTREIIGRIEIYGENDGFIETSSRNTGFINSFEMKELEDFFYEYIFKPLEKYVFNVIHWAEDFADNESLADNIETFDDIEALLKKIKSKYKKENLISASFNNEIIEIINSRKQKTISKEIDELKNIARKAENEELIEKAEEVEKRTKALEKRVKETQKVAQASEKKQEKINKELEITKRQVGVLQSRVDVSVDDAINAMHIIKTYADTIDSNIEEIFDIVKTDLSVTEIVEVLHKIRQTCSKIMNAYNLVINTDYNAETGNKNLNIVKFVREYIEKQWLHKFYIRVEGETEVNIPFNPLEFSIIIDNIANNSVKANANALEIIFEKSEQFIEITFRDDGYGVNDESDCRKFFEQGYTTTKGTGIGLYTVKNYVEKMNGTILVNNEYKSGFEMKMRFKNGH